MARVSSEEREQRLKKLLRLYMLRSKGGSSEDRFAQELGFFDSAGAPSARVMYERFLEWGLPDWVVYPDGASEHTETIKEHKVRDGGEIKERKARGTGDTKDLPSAGRALDLFRKDLEHLTYYLDQLPGLKEQLQAGRFVSSFWVGEDWEYYPKSKFSEEEWKELCERYGEDPSVKELRFAIDPIKPPGC